MNGRRLFDDVSALFALFLPNRDIWRGNGNKLAGRRMETNSLGDRGLSQSLILPNVKTVCVINGNGDEWDQEIRRVRWTLGVTCFGLSKRSAVLELLHPALDGWTLPNIFFPSPGDNVNVVNQPRC